MSVMSSTSTKQPETTASVRKPGLENAQRKRVILSMGGKGGVGKTNVMTGLAEWYRDHEIPVTLLDLDTENKARGSLTHFFDGPSPEGQHSHSRRPGCISGLPRQRAAHRPGGHG